MTFIFGVSMKGSQYKIRLGDCMEIMKEIPDHSVDLVLCDPPYGLMPKSQWDKSLPLDQLWEEYERICKPNGIILIFGIEPFASMVRVSNINNYRHDWIWKKSKTGWLNCRTEPLRDHENIMVFYSSDIKTDRSKYFTEIKDYLIEERKKAEAAGYSMKNVLGNAMAKHYFTRFSKWNLPTEEAYLKLQSTGFFLRPYSEIRAEYEKEWNVTYNPQMTAGEPYKGGGHDSRKTVYGSKTVHATDNQGIRYPTQILEFAPDKDKLHPTQKPVKLLEYLIRTYTNPGETVLDNTAGSGSTGVAALNTGRIFIGVEADGKYYEIMRARLENQEKGKIRI